MKSQNLFSVKNKKNIMNLSSAEFAQRMVTVNSKEHAYLATDIEDSWITTIFDFNLLMSIVHLEHLREQGPWITRSTSLWGRW